MMKSLLLIVLLLNSCSFLKNYPQDNIVEEMVEGTIYYEFHVDLDLSPNSAEGNVLEQTPMNK